MQIEHYGEQPIALAELLSLAESGDVDAQLHLGWAYGKYGPLGVNEEKAEYWLRKAADSGRIEPMRYLARFLVVANRPEALETIQALIQRGDFSGHYLMGHVLRSGLLGLEPNLDQALGQFEKAAQLGHLISRMQALRFREWFWIRPMSVFRFVALSLQMVCEMWRNPQSDSLFR